jgi:hypothetical protein
MDSQPSDPIVQNLAPLVPKENLITRFKFIKDRPTDSLGKEFTNILWKDVATEGACCAASSRFAAVSISLNKIPQISLNLYFYLHSSHGNRVEQEQLLSVRLTNQRNLTTISHF